MEVRRVAGEAQAIKNKQRLGGKAPQAWYPATHRRYAQAAPSVIQTTDSSQKQASTHSAPMRATQAKDPTRGYWPIILALLSLASFSVTSKHDVQSSPPHEIVSSNFSDSLPCPASHSAALKCSHSKCCHSKCSIAPPPFAKSYQPRA